MGIETSFNAEELKNRLQTIFSEIDFMQIETLAYLGEQCVSHARSIPSDIGFQDQTGNLRSSIGYAIFRDGQALGEYFPVHRNAQEGCNTGRNIAQEVGSGIRGLCLVVVAGMHYAVYVEAKGRDVLCSAEQLALREAPRMLEELKKDIQEAFSKP